MAQRDGTPFEIVLGPRGMALLPAEVAKFHSRHEAFAIAGVCDVEGSAHAGARLLRWLGRLPSPGRDVAVRVVVEPLADGSEAWRRDFAGRRFASVLRAGRGGDEGLLLERIGLVELAFTLDPGPEGLAWETRFWRIAGLPFRFRGGIRAMAVESTPQGRYTFDASVAFAWLGPVLRYKGWLEIAPLSPAGGG